MAMDLPVDVLFRECQNMNETLVQLATDLNY